MRRVRPFVTSVSFVVNSLHLLPLGDQAVLAYLPDEPAAIRFAAAVRTANPPWLQDVVPAYASVGIFFDADMIRLNEVMEWLEQRLGEPGDVSPRVSVSTRELTSPGSPTTHRIPVCYEMQLDLPRVCEHTGLTADEVIRRHAATE